MEITQEKNNKNTVKILSIICPLVYFASYLTRKNYSVVMAEIIISEGISNSQASLAATLSLISYGLGQVISGILGDKFKPQNIISIGLISTAVFNSLMPLAQDPILRAVIWFANGFAQALIWPPLVRIMAAYLNEKKYNDLCTNVNLAGSFGTIILYLTASSIWIKFFNWKYVFVSSALTCAVISVAWIFGFKKIQNKSLTIGKKSTAKANGTEKLTFSQLMKSGFLLIAVGIITQGALRDGMTDWVPSFIINTFKIESSSAILKSVALPVIGLISLKIIGVINGKYLHNAVQGGAITFLISFVLCAALLGVYTKNQYVTLALSALITGFMHAINFLIVCILPAKFEKYGLVSTMSGVLNSLTYIGSAAATYGFGAIADRFNWNSVIITWVITAFIGTVCCLIAAKKWGRFIKE